MVKPCEYDKCDKYDKYDNWKFHISAYQWLYKMAKFHRHADGKVSSVNKSISNSRKVDNNRKDFMYEKRRKIGCAINSLIMAIVFIELSINAYGCLEVKKLCYYQGYVFTIILMKWNQ